MAISLCPTAGLYRLRDDIAHNDAKVTSSVAIPRVPGARRDNACKDWHVARSFPADRCLRGFTFRCLHNRLVDHTYFVLTHQASL